VVLGFSGIYALKSELLSLVLEFDDLGVYKFDSPKY
jgi:hypothetical protein